VKKSTDRKSVDCSHSTCIRANNRIQFEVALRRAGFQGTPNATPVATPSELLPNRKFRFIPKVSKQTLGWN
jgi:hypothetical protein